MRLHTWAPSSSFSTPPPPAPDSTPELNEPRSAFPLSHTHAPSRSSLTRSLTLSHTPSPHTVKAAKEPSARGGCCYFSFSPSLFYESPPSSSPVAGASPSAPFSPPPSPPPPPLVPQTRNRLKPVQTGRFHLGLVFSPWRLGACGRGGGKASTPNRPVSLLVPSSDGEGGGKPKKHKRAYKKILRLPLATQDVHLSLSRFLTQARGCIFNVCVHERSHAPPSPAEVDWSRIGEEE